jgi:predicted RNase H-like nuclease (RuvC/YqgF family)
MTLLLVNLAGIAELSRSARQALQRRAGCYNFSPRETMSNLVKVVAQLRQQRDEAQRTVEQLDRALAALDSVDGLRSRGRGSHVVGRKGRTMSTAARKRIAAAQRARWAKWKAAQKKK